MAVGKSFSTPGWVHRRPANKGPKARQIISFQKFSFLHRLLHSEVPAWLARLLLCPKRVSALLCVAIRGGPNLFQYSFCSVVLVFTPRGGLLKTLTILGDLIFLLSIPRSSIRSITGGRSLPRFWCWRVPWDFVLPVTTTAKLTIAHFFSIRRRAQWASQPTANIAAKRPFHLSFKMCIAIFFTWRLFSWFSCGTTRSRVFSSTDNLALASAA